MATDIKRIVIAIDATEAERGGKKVDEALGRVSREADRTDKAIDRVEKSTKQAGAELGRLSKGADAATDRVRRFREAQERAEKSTARMTGALRGLLAGYLGLAAIRRVTQEIASFDQALASLSAVSGLDRTSKQFRDLEKTARTLGATTTFTAAEAVGGLENLARAGLEANEQIAAIRPTLNLAKVATLDLDDAAQIVARTLKQYSLDAGEAARVTDILTKTSVSSNTQVSGLADSLEKVAPVAASLSIPLEEVVATIGALGDRGLEGAIAGTQLRGSILKLVDPSREAREAMEALGISSKSINLGVDGIAGTFERFRAAGLDAGAAARVFGLENAAAGLIVTESTKRIRELTEANEKSSGVAERAAKVAGDNLAGSIKSLQSAASEAVLATGDKGLTGALRGIVDTGTAVIRNMSGVDEATGDTAFEMAEMAARVEYVKAASVALVAVPLSRYLVGVARSIGAVTIALASNPFTLIVAGAAAAAAAIYSLGTANEAYNRTLRSNQDIYRDLESRLDNTALRVAALSETFEDLTDVMGLDVSAQRAVHALREGLGEAIDGAKERAADLGHEMIGLARVSDDSLRPLVKNALDAVDILLADRSAKSRFLAAEIVSGFLDPIVESSPVVAHRFGEEIKAITAELKRQTEAAEREVASLSGPSREEGYARAGALLVDRAPAAARAARQAGRRIAAGLEEGFTEYLKQAASAQDAIDALVDPIDELEARLQSEIGLVGASSSAREKATLTRQAEEVVAAATRAGLVEEGDRLERLRRLIDELTTAKERNAREEEDRRRRETAIDAAGGQIESLRFEIELIGKAATERRRLAEARQLSSALADGSLPQEEADAFKEQLEHLQDIRDAEEERIRRNEEILEKLKEQRDEQERLGREYGSAVGSSVGDFAKTGDVNALVTGLQDKLTDVYVRNTIEKPIEDAITKLFVGEVDDQIRVMENLRQQEQSLTQAVYTLDGTIKSVANQVPASVVGGNGGSGGTIGSVPINVTGGASNTALYANGGGTSNTVHVSGGASPAPAPSSGGSNLSFLTQGNLVSSLVGASGFGVSGLSSLLGGLGDVLGYGSYNGLLNNGLGSLLFADTGSLTSLLGGLGGGLSTAGTALGGSGGLGGLGSLLSSILPLLAFKNGGVIDHGNVVRFGSGGVGLGGYGSIIGLPATVLGPLAGPMLSAAFPGFGLIGGALGGGGAKGFADGGVSAVALPIVSGILQGVLSNQGGGGQGGGGKGFADGGITLLGASLIGSLGGSALGGGGGKGFATGGFVVNSPTMFPLAGGAKGVMGEAGPEAIMPLTRTATGKLGVRAEGGGGGGPTTIINVTTPDADSFRRSQYLIQEDRQRVMERYT